MGTHWSYLDITALERQRWWNLHDEYDKPTVFEAALSDAAASQRGSASRRS